MIGVPLTRRIRGHQCIAVADPAGIVYWRRVADVLRELGTGRLHVCGCGAIVARFGEAIAVEQDTGEIHLCELAA